MDNVKLSRFTLLLLAGCVVLMTAAYILFLTATWNQLQVDRLRRDERLDNLLDRIPSPRKKDAGTGTAVLGVRQPDACETDNPDQIQRPGNEILRTVREQTAEDAPAGDETIQE